MSRSALFRSRLRYRIDLGKGRRLRTKTLRTRPLWRRVTSEQHERRYREPPAPVSRRLLPGGIDCAARYTGLGVSGTMRPISRDTAEVAYRRATRSDVEPLSRICRGSFVHSTRWQAGGDFAVNWWRTAAESDFAEVWVALVDGQLAGAAVLVFEENGWARERRARCGTRRDYVLASLRAPQSSVAEALHRVDLRIAYWTAAVGSEPHPLSTDRTWMELLVISASMQGRNIATRLKSFCEARSIALGRSLLESCVDPRNARMRQLNERLGYIHTRQAKSGCIYSKELRPLPAIS